MDQGDQVDQGDQSGISITTEHVNRVLPETCLLGPETCYLDI